MPLAGEIVTALDGPVEAEDSTDVTSTSTAFEAGSPSVSLTFIAPASGKVIVTVYAQIEAASTSSGYCGFEIRLTNVSGSVVIAANTDVAAAQQEPAFSGSSRRKLVTGLTPGQLYFARTMHRTTVAANAATMFVRALLVEPVA